MNKTKIVKFIISISICQAAGVVGSLFTSPAIPTWYAALQKPSFNPPNWLFAPVWTALFILMGISLYLIWSRGLENRRARTAVFIFGVQLILNILWSILFFGLQFPLYAFIEIIILWLAILLTITSFYRISKIAGLLLMPYIFWVSFAGYLNYSIWQLQINALEPVACTMEAKLCPDGSYVSRTGPNCEFAFCLDAPQWSAIKQAIVNCEVESVWQTHDRAVGAKLKSGEELTAVEPELDDIIDLAIAAEPECGKILMGTE